MKQNFYESFARTAYGDDNVSDSPPLPADTPPASSPVASFALDRRASAAVSNHFHRRARRPLSEVQCYECGQQGHYADPCRRRKRARQERR